MMKARLLSLFVAALALCWTGCTSKPAPKAEPEKTATATPIPTPQGPRVLLRLGPYKVPPGSGGVAPDDGLINREYDCGSSFSRVHMISFEHRTLLYFTVLKLCGKPGENMYAVVPGYLLTRRPDGSADVEPLVDETKREAARQFLQKRRLISSKTPINFWR